MNGEHVANFISMVPNKRGPVELGLLAIGREWVARGGRFSVSYLAEPEPWYAELLAEAGIETGSVGRDTWHSDIIQAATSTPTDIVHLHMDRHSMAKELTGRGIAVVRTEHSVRRPRFPEPLRRIVRWYRQRPLSGYTCVSKFLADQTRRDFLVPASRLRVIYNGCDLERFHPRRHERERLMVDVLGADPTDRVVTVAAHLIPLKQQHLLIEALPLVLPRVPQARVVIAGDGPDRERLHALARQLRVIERVTFLHGDNDVAEIYAASHVGALTSRGEGLGGSAIEAQACGIPLIATQVGGLTEAFVDGTTGLAVEQTAESVAEAMVRLLGDDEERERMGAAARSFCEEKFAPQVQVEATCRFYLDILDGRRSS